MVQTVLGSGGAIGIPLAKALRLYSTHIRLVSRNPSKVNEEDELFSADLTDKEQVLQAVEGSAISYLIAGLEYNTRIWQLQWPQLMENVVEACIHHKSKLVFLDNVYALDEGHMHHITEQSPMNPKSKKGKVRAAINRYLMDKVEKGNLEAIIARAPDYFGPIKEKSLLMNLVYDNLAKGKPAQWLCNADAKHTVGYSVDLASGMAILGNSKNSYNQVWNLPVDDQAPTARQWVTWFAEAMNAINKVRVLPGWGIWTLGQFIPVLKETYEMKYQYEHDYYFDSKKFKSKFDFTPTKNVEAIRQSISELKQVKEGMIS